MRARISACFLYLMVNFSPLPANVWCQTVSNGLLPEKFNRIQPFNDNSRFWQYRGSPLLLIGGSKDDNLFQLPDLSEHLDEIKAVGGNYIRNTMSDRRDKGFEVYPFKQLADGKYDLSQWNEQYWNRFENMLIWTGQRDIIVQIELWDRFDYSDHRKSGHWSRNPYNPKNNVNYTSQQSGLKLTYTRHPGKNEQPFFYTVPELQNNRHVLRYQLAQIDKLLSYSLRYGHVLYCIDNETSGSPGWGEFWARHIRRRAQEQGVDVYITEMWDSWEPLSGRHKSTYDHPELYGFADVSQNNHQKGEMHWRNLMDVRRYLSDNPWPINTVKIYGTDNGHFGSSRDGEERFWRNIFGGVAATRFHRPPAGLGLGDRSKRHIMSIKMLVDELDIFRCEPDGDHRLLSGREENEAYLIAQIGQQYAVYFPAGGSVRLDLTSIEGQFEVKWLDVEKTRWQAHTKTTGGKPIELRAPAGGHWVALVTRADVYGPGD